MKSSRMRVAMKSSRLRVVFGYSGIGSSKIEMLQIEIEKNTKFAREKF